MLVVPKYSPSAVISAQARWPGVADAKLDSCDSGRAGLGDGAKPRLGRFRDEAGAGARLRPVKRIGPRSMRNGSAKRLTMVERGRPQ